MPFEWFVAIRYLKDGKGQTALILAAVSVGVSVIVFLSALIGGLQTSLIEKTLGSQPHITLRMPREAPRALIDETDERKIARNQQETSQRLRSIDQWPQAMATIERSSGVISVSPSIAGSGFAVRSEAKSPIVIRGIDPDRFLSIIDVRKKIKTGRFDVEGSDVAIGASLASDLGVRVGDKLRIVSSEGVEDVVTITGIFRLGNEGVDKTWMLTSLRNAQALFGLPGGATTLEAKVADVFDAERIAVDLNAQTGLQSDSWMKINADLLAGLSAQSSSKSMIQFFVAVAVALGIASVLIVSVVQKSREIGILRAVGTPSRRVLLVFLIQGGVLGLAGSITGSLFGVLLAKAFESIAVDETGAPKFPVQLNLSLFLFAGGLAIVVGLLAALIPARSAARLDPATAIRNG